MARLAAVAAFGFPDFQPATLLPVFGKLGCKTCQFYRNPDDPPKTEAARSLVEDLGMPFDSMHGLFGPDLDPSSPDDTVRNRALDQYRAEGELALQLGGPAVVVHPSPAAPDSAALTDDRRAARVDPLRRSIEQLAKTGEQLGVTYLIENLPGNFPMGANPIQLAQLIREHNHPRVRMCYDTGHAHMTGHPPASLTACKDVIGYLHIHDNDAVHDSHMIPGEGTIDWDSLATAVASVPPSTPAMLELFVAEASLDQKADSGLGQQLAQWLSDTK